MISSPDLVAFTKDDDFRDTYVEINSLPEQFSLPLFPYAGNANPWAKASFAKFTKDFILISEFSEQVGPQPLLTVPDDPKAWGTFDLNYFSLRIMSVDYQASFVGHPPGCGYPKLNFVEDSKVVLGDSKEGAFAYVHHLTLYDLEARGFVRPFCMAYISSDEDKIMQQFQELSSEFSKASECLKTGNRKAFANELEKKLKDLEYTRTVLHKEAELQKKENGCYSTQAIEKANELANVEKSIYEHKDLLKQVTSYPNRKMKDPEFLPYEPEPPSEPPGADQDQISGVSNPDHPSDNPSNTRRPSYTPQFIKAKSAKCFDKRLKTLEELCDVYFFNQTMDQLTQIEKIFRGDLCYISTSQIDTALLKQQKITNFLFEVFRDWEEEPEKPQYGENLAPNSNNSSNPAPSNEPASLESYTSCVETVLIKMEQDISEEGQQETESSLCDITQDNSEECLEADMKGSVSSGESIEVLGTERSFPAQGSFIQSESQASLQVHYPEVVRRKEASKRTNSQDSIEVLSTTESIIPEDLRASCPGAIYEEEPYNDSSLEHMYQSPASSQRLVDSGMQDAGGFGKEATEQADSACCIGQEGPRFEEPAPELGQECSDNGVVKVAPRSSRAGEQAPGVDDGAPAALLSYELNLIYLSDEVSRLDLDDVSDSTSFMSTSTSSERAASPFLSGNPITVKHKRKAGQGALRFIRQYPFAQQAIFSLLSGRTLVVMGADEGKVRKLVSALSIFVPNLGKYAETIKPWLTSPFQITDLHSWKLIGLHRVASPTGSSMLFSLNRYSRYISILDADHKTLRCPPYKGTLIGRLADHRTQIKRGSTYFMYVQSMLSQLCSKAFLYTFCHHLHLPIHPGEGDASVASRRRGFLQHQLGISGEDVKIVQFLGELIKLYYLQEPGKGATPPVFRFDYTTSFLYKI
ncbi:Smith-Magenis syndrome chromosomal region candidate gene 8 protein [Acipenser ruthenus]|uniref:Smith-Magenis syndrome chromosomal region candidate gene 8 protein n=1 Tax=Acipenser ruthenus TaxID=7906 RepID=A0A444UBH9_ACIRT|nr:Smith-Magenis syndrome chromosomal region candidate gene 8 protein [Acipenser ruthenus]